MDPSDLKTQSELVESTLAGDHSAWGILMRHHQEAAYRLAFLISGDPDEAEDIAQEAFLRAYRGLKRFDTERPMRPWLLQITKNTAYNHRRRARRYLDALEKAFKLNPNLLPTANSPAQASTNRDQRNQLWQAVQRLAARDQEVIYLRYFMELSEIETAAILTVPVGTVKSRTHRALKRLRAVVLSFFPELIEGQR